MASATQAQQPKLDQVLDRMRMYLQRFDERMASVVANERYRQVLETRFPRLRETRILRSDYALVQTAEGRWVGYRDTYEVDGKPVRDREERLLRLLAGGAVVEARQIAEESARFNVGDDLIVRDVNVPSLALQFFEPRNISRFSFHKEGEEKVEGVPVWRISYRERERPTIVRTHRGADITSRGYVWVSPDDGAIWKTTIIWNEPTAFLNVTYGRASIDDVLVPMQMHERYDGRSATVSGEATYSDFRRFETGGRLVIPSETAR